MLVELTLTETAGVEIPIKDVPKPFHDNAVIAASGMRVAVVDLDDIPDAMLAKLEDLIRLGKISLDSKPLPTAEPTTDTVRGNLRERLGTAAVLCSVPIAALEVTTTVGTFTPTVEGNMIKLIKTPGDNTSLVIVPITPAVLRAGNKGFRLDSVDVWWANAAADLDALSAVLYKKTLGANAVAAAGAVVATTYDTDHDAAGERITQANHKMTLSLDTAEEIAPGEQLELVITVDAAALSEFDFLGAQANGVARI